ncbi:hypothetical protein LGR64_13350 [Delftia sp. Lp-1]|uniref:hypothetical protein n=1 Tax=Delftia sp. Lp-1 TaxID=682863 RepID=UPI001E5B0D15|nr:hypothetical protein [Delftia sp. Lp-1]MCB4787262.1 hypothetical protein [Delftia sp. Lp-1]
MTIILVLFDPGRPGRRAIEGKLSTHQHPDHMPMIFLAITSTGLAQALRAATENDAIWCGSDAMSEADSAARQWSNLSRFTYSLEDRVLIDDAVSTIEEHHPGHTVWVEASSLR